MTPREIAAEVYAKANEEGRAPTQAEVREAIRRFVELEDSEEHQAFVRECAPK
jgi:hypothetical protein